MESWTNCPVRQFIDQFETTVFLLRVHLYQNFEKHVADFYKSDEFKKREKDAEPFFNGVRDYIFGRPATLANIVRCSVIVFIGKILIFLSSDSGT